MNEGKETFLEKHSHSHFGGFRSKLTIALMMGLYMTGCQDEKPEKKVILRDVTLPEVSVKKSKSSKPEKNVCSQKIKSDENVRKYPQVPRKNIQGVLDKFEGAETTIESFSGNGCRDVVIFIPDGFDPNEDIELQYHFHGSHGNFIGVPMPYNNTKWIKKGKETVAERRITHALTAISEKVKEHERNTILVYPLSAGRRKGDWFAYNFGYDDLWMKKGNDTGDSMEALDSQVRSAVRTKFGISTKDASVTLSGHSAGGRPIMHAVQSGFIPDKIKFLEATYLDWAQKTYQKIVNEGSDVQIEILFKPHADTHTPAIAMRGEKNVTVTPIKGMKHGQFVGFI